MKRTQVAALLAGAALGLTGITAAVVLSRKEGRDAARRLIEKGRPVAEQAKVFGGKAAILLEPAGEEDARVHVLLVYDFRDRLRIEFSRPFES